MRRIVAWRGRTPPSSLAVIRACLGLIALVGLLGVALVRERSPAIPQHAPSTPTVPISPVSAVAPLVLIDPTSTVVPPTRAIASPAPRPTTSASFLRIVRTAVANVSSVSATPTHPVAVDFPSAGRGWLLDGDCDGVGSGECTIFATIDGGMTWQPQLRTHLILQSVVFVNTDDGWVPGEECAGQGTRRSCTGILLTTTNGGTTWTADRTGTVILSDVWFVSPRLGWAVASGCPLGQQPCASELRQSTDGGATWHTVSLGGFWVSAVRFVDAQHGWIAGCADPGDVNRAHGCAHPEVRATSDGGKTWQTQLHLPATPDSFGASLDFIDARDGWLLTSSPDGCTMGGCWGPLYRTTDGGRAWMQLQPDYHWQVTGDLNGVPPGFPGAPVFVSPTVGWIPITAGAGPGAGGIARTTDGGKTWVRAGGLEGWEIGDVSAVTPQSAWIVGSRRFTGLSFLLHSDDGGQTWTQRLPTPAPVRVVDFLNHDHGWGIATSSDPSAVLATVDRGHTWSQLASVAHVDLAAASFVDPEHGWVAGEDLTLRPLSDVLLATDDGGHTWRKVATPAESVVAVRFFSARDGILLTGQDGGGALPVTIQVTHDGGATWTNSGQVPRSGSAISVRASDFVDLTTGWIVTLDRSGVLHLWTTWDGGRNWQRVGAIPSGPVWSTVSLRAISGSVVWIGFGQTLLTTNDGGQSWTRVTLPPDVAVESLDGIDSRIGWLVTNDGRLLETEDGGVTWSERR